MESEIERARLLIHVGRLTEALDLLDRSAGGDPDDPFVQILRSACLLDLGRAPEALDAAHRACAIEPESGHAHLMRCRALRRLDAPPAELLAAAGLAVRYEPEDVTAWEQFVTAYVLSGRFDDAERALADMRSRFPTDAETEVAAALVEVQRPSGVDRLITAMASPLGMLVLVVFALSGGGLVLYLAVTGIDRWRRHRSAGRARIAIERALAEEPDSYRLQWMLAHFYEEQGRYLAALDLHLRMGAVEPRPELVQRVLATARRGLWIILVPIVAATVVSVVALGGLIADGTVPGGMGLVGIAVIVVGAALGARSARGHWLARFPPGVASTVQLWRGAGPSSRRRSRP